MKKFTTEQLVFFSIGGLTVLALIFIVIFSLSEQKQTQGQTPVASYRVSDTEKPKITTGEVFSDLGKMKVKDEKSAQFILENTGNKPLQLFKISSSCDCTLGQITIGETKSPEFAMHANNTWVGSVEPGKKAILSVIYRPYIMPVKGPVTRDVYVQTNDPENPSLTFTVKADVE